MATGAGVQRVPVTPAPYLNYSAITFPTSLRCSSEGRAWMALLNETDDMAKQHELISENIETEVLHHGLGLAIYFCLLLFSQLV